MKNYEPAQSFGEDTAAVYDKIAVRGDETETVAFLEDLAHGGPALELAIGTGRIALPLAARGVRVDGIDISEAMVARLREKPGGDKLNVIIGDFADVGVDGSYNLIYIVFNTLFNLLTQDDQVRCFENVARHLPEDGEDGLFLVEAFVLPSIGLQDGQYVHAQSIEVDRVTLDIAQYDPVTQLLTENHVTISARGTHLNPIVTRYSSPSELDLMAHIAGLRLIERWAGWQREPFTGSSSRAVSVYGRRP